MGSKERILCSICETYITLSGLPAHVKTKKHRTTGLKNLTGNQQKKKLVKPKLIVNVEVTNVINPEILAPVDDDWEECPICMENPADVMFVCGHSLCDTCYPKVTICPFCRAPLVRNLEGTLRTLLDKSNEEIKRINNRVLNSELVEDEMLDLALDIIKCQGHFILCVERKKIITGGERLLFDLSVKHLAKTWSKCIEALMKKYEQTGNDRFNITYQMNGFVIKKITVMNRNRRVMTLDRMRYNHKYLRLDSGVSVYVLNS